MNFDRTDRISEEVRREVDRIIREDVRDPRVAGTWSITRADVTRDLRYAKIRVSVLEEEQRKPLVKALKNAAGFIRRELGKNLRLRYTPELTFAIDTSLAYSAHIQELLLKIEKEEGQGNGDADKSE